MQPLYHHVQLAATRKDLWNCGESLFGMDYKLINSILHLDLKLNGVRTFDIAYFN